MPPARVLALLLATLMVLGCAEAEPAPATGVRITADGWHALARPIDPAQQTSLAFGQRSHWMQPWRGYFETPPARKLLAAPGIQLNVEPADLPRTARRVARAGFRRGRIELGWDRVSPADPTRLADPRGVTAQLRALRRAGVRPLILLNGDEGSPGPVERLELELAAPVLAGSRSALLTPASAERVIPGRTGVDTGHRAAGLLITGRDGTRVSFARPSPLLLAAGRVPASTLPYAPFTQPRSADGRPHPVFERTLTGWLAYVGAVSRTARSVLGNGFDVEVWNELTLNSGFLDARNYYDPLPPELAGTGDTNATILARTVEYLRDPRRRLRGVGIGDGFSNQTPFATGAGAPRGLTAIDKHPYPRVLGFPSAGQSLVGPAQPVGPDGTPASFEPEYATFFPEYYLTAVQTEHLVRDVSPLVTEVSGEPHGRTVARPGRRPPEVWITETGLAGGGPGPATDPPRGVVFTGAERDHFNAKVVLRTLSAFVNKGVANVFFYAASGDEYGLLPADRAAPVLPALRRYLGAFGGRAQPISRRRALRLEEVADDHDAVQWAGDPAAGLPPLYDRDVLAVLPFQVTDRRFAVAVYVMTRDLARRYGGAEGVVSPYDLPPERFRVRLGGVDGRRAQIALRDPITGARAPATVAGRAADSVTVELLATDYPRVLTIQERRR